MNYRQCVIVTFLLFVSTVNMVQLLAQVNTAKNSPHKEETPQQFFFAFLDSDNYKIISKNVQTVYENEEIVIVDHVLRNEIMITIIDRESEALLLYGRTNFFEEGIKISSYDYQYTINSQGFRISSEGDRNISFVKDVPVFPDSVIQKGDSWQSSSVEYFSIPTVISIVEQKISVPIEVEYSYMGHEKLPQSYYSDSYHNKDTGIQLPLFFIRYEIIDHVYTMSKTPDTTVRINAVFDIFLWWNDIFNRPEFYVEDYLMSFFSPLGDLKVEGAVISRVIPIVDSQANFLGPLPFIENDLRKALKQEEPSIQRNEKGLQLSFDNILFYPNTDEPVGSLDKVLAPVISVLEKYAPQKLLVEGHTADVGDFLAQKRLSVNRSKIVKEYLQKQLGWNENNFEIRGYGADKPVAPNDTKAGREKNRRVEITILE